MVDRIDEIENKLRMRIDEYVDDIGKREKLKFSVEEIDRNFGVSSRAIDEKIAGNVFWPLIGVGFEKDKFLNNIIHLANLKEITDEQSDELWDIFTDIIYKKTNVLEKKLDNSWRLKEKYKREF